MHACMHTHMCTYITLQYICIPMGTQPLMMMVMVVMFATMMMVRTTPPCLQAFPATEASRNECPTNSPCPPRVSPQPTHSIITTSAATIITATATI